MQRFLPFSLFFLFILWVIWQADSNGTNYFFTWVENMPLKDKMGHFVLYGILALLLDIALRHANVKVYNVTFSKAALVVIAFALLEEFTQIWIDARSFDLRDALADVLGVFTCVYCGRFVAKSKRQKKKFQDNEMP